MVYTHIWLVWNLFSVIGFDQPLFRRSYIQIHLSCGHISECGETHRGILIGNFRQEISGGDRWVCVCVPASFNVLLICQWISPVSEQHAKCTWLKLSRKSFNQTCLRTSLTCQEFSLRPKETCGSNKENSFICIGKLNWLFNHLSRALNWIKCKARLDTACQLFYSY